MFVLPFNIPENPEQIHLHDPIFCMGSCFAEHIGIKLSGSKLDAVTNPLGTIYNPYSILKNLRLLLTEGLDPNNSIQNNGIYYHWDTHSVISASDPQAFHQRLLDTSHQLKQKLLKCRWLIITPGTARVYRYLKNDEIVANCHKVPGREFDHFLLSPAEIVADYLETIRWLRAENPTLKVILSVSPVRHVRDGLVENNLSKAILLQAVSQIVEKDEKTYYFPAYELMIDVLRDYRFYQPDMIHPSAQAVDYIWQQFVAAYMDGETQDFIARWAGIQKSLAHRPFHPGTPAHQKFLKATIKQLKGLESKVDVTSEIRELEEQLD